MNIWAIFVKILQIILFISWGFSISSQWEKFLYNFNVFSLHKNLNKRNLVYLFFTLCKTGILHEPVSLSPDIILILYGDCFWNGLLFLAENQTRFKMQDR